MKPEFLNTCLFSPCISSFHLSRFRELQWHATLSLDSRSPEIRFAEIPKIPFDFYHVSRFWVFPFTMSHPLVNRTLGILILEIMKRCYSPLLRRSTVVIFSSDPTASSISRTGSSICQSSNSMSSRPSSHRTSEIPNGISPPSVFINLARKSPNLPLVVSTCTMLSMCTPATCHLFLFMGFWPPFNSPFLFWTFGYREFDTLDPSLMSSQSLNFRIPIFRAVKTLLHYSFAFRDFKDSDMECYAFCQWECRNPDVWNADNHSVATSNFRLSSLLYLDLSPLGLLKPQTLKFQKFKLATPLSSHTKTPFRISGIWSAKDFGLHFGPSNPKMPKWSDVPINQYQRPNP